ncbi:anaerobic ribonucleoside-triphosphate reductase [Prevotella lacticifex]|uniref:Ribonucleoside-triphosphate reductase n=1 Tax=Prevotella lacticifex TaxID=2854755 RepID=A0A9R1C831_9BACT|nr:anaerobic ribonucleoside-triphosphate reductase [Prevotella lacticifex]GJG37830.1 ribonucleoside-triphosphate reductase [Prevotella lacticifex]GJG40825.1 ribonucleoside-triphosphate reductase [Prevotella lacticifex]GJG43704.1 ribonucleoside-triphosphate reductase [Prevotella lacticifex]GJG47485.1 ribonucleoside-triphosphate reductase [Prevotella lacticifex]GJG49863.1 ribonucleoside-triphosphate reductase [Prevotella lacticifex]
MEIKNFTITKRDGSREQFSLDKIMNAILKAFDSVKQPADLGAISKILSHLNIHNDITVEDIQNEVEEALMREGYYKVAKSFIIYRQEHTEDREAVQQMKFLTDYMDADNAATGSKFDANANVEHKNIATLIGELPKRGFIRLNRRLLTERIKKMYGKALADEYLDKLNHHFIYKNDETNLANYCASITMYPWLIGGTTSIGGNSTAPTNLKSFCGGFINMVFIVSSMLAGACATPEFLMYMNYFIEKEYGKDYWKHPDEVVDLSLRHRTLDKVITDYFEQIVYSLNQPTGARNFQAVFWNISYYDKYYFESLFGNFFFPDGTRPDWDGLNWLQKRFMKWFNKERTRTVLTFPVETMALLTENGDCKDKEWGDFAAEMYSEGHSFFTYMSDNADSLSSCCRLRNEIQDNGFSYTLGAGGVSTGSKSVLTINLNRCIQYAVNHKLDYKEYLSGVIDLCHKVQLAYNENLKQLQKNHMLPLFDAGYINMSRQYLTIGINGLVEAAEFMGLKITPNDDYLHFVQGVLGLVEKYNKAYRTKDVMFNCEMIPAENVGVKHAKWDREDGYFVPRDCYNSYFYVVEDDSLTILDKFKLHGAPYIEHLTGGSALHMNLEEHLSKAQYRQLLRVAAQEGCNYFTFNIPNTVCNDCGHIDKRYLHECPVCHSKNVDYLTRVIGYLKRVSNFSMARQEEAHRRYYATKEKYTVGTTQDDLDKAEAKAAEMAKPKTVTVK